MLRKGCKGLGVLAASAAILVFLVYLPLQAEAQPRDVKESVMHSMTNYPKIKSFQEYRESSVYDIDRARSGWFPRLDARAGYGPRIYSDEGNRTTNRDDVWDMRSDGELVLSQTLWDGWATQSRYDLAKERYSSADSRLFDNAEAIALDTVLAHIEVLRLSKIVALSEENILSHEQILAGQHERVSSGASSLADVTQTQARLARAHSSLASYQGELEAAIANYIALTGVAPTELAPVDYPDATPLDYQETMRTAITDNPKLAALKSDARAATANTNLAKSAYHPNIYLEAGTLYKDHIDSSESWARGTTVLVRMNWNLFNGLYDYYNVKSSKALERQARHDINDQFNILDQEVKTTWSNLAAAREQVKFYGDAVDYDIQTRDMYAQQFALGERSLLDVLDSENELYNSSMLLVTSKANEIGAGYKILAIAGHLIDSLGISRTAFAKEGVGGDPNEVNDWTERPVSPDPQQPAVAPENYIPLAERQGGPMQ